MLRVPPLVVTATSSVPGDAPRRADAMMAAVTVSELLGLTTRSFTGLLPVSLVPESRRAVNGADNGAMDEPTFPIVEVKPAAAAADAAIALSVVALFTTVPPTL